MARKIEKLPKLQEHYRKLNEARIKLASLLYEAERLEYMGARTQQEVNQGVKSWHKYMDEIRDYVDTRMEKPMAQAVRESVRGY